MKGADMFSDTTSGMLDNLISDNSNISGINAFFNDTFNNYNINASGNQTLINATTLAGSMPAGGPPRGFGHRATPDILSLQELDRKLDEAMPVALSLGVAGNVVAVLAFMLSPLKYNSLSHYLTALAVADVMHLLACLVLWVSYHGWNIYTKVGVCQLTSFVLLMSRFLIVWYLLSAHVERLLVQFGKAGSKRWCTVFRTKCVILSVFVLSLVAFLHYIWSHVVILQHGVEQCTTMKESVIHINRLRRVELILALFLPMLLMAIMDAAVVGKMINDCIITCKTRTPSTSSSRRLLCFRTKTNARGNGGSNGNSKTICPTEKDYALAENGEVTALASVVNNHHHNSSQQTGPDILNNCNGLNASSAAITAKLGVGTGGNGGSGGRNTRGSRKGKSVAGHHRKEDDDGEEERRENKGPSAEDIRLMDLNREKTLSTVVCVLVGLVFIGLTLPSAYLRARMSFAEQKGRFPLTMYEVNLMRVFEKVYQFNGVYKVLVYALFLPSFRRAVWFVTKKIFRLQALRDRCSTVGARVARSCACLDSRPVHAPV